MPPESDIKIHRFIAASPFEDVFPERISSHRVEKAVFPEEAEGICIEYFCPFVAIVAGSIAAPKIWVKAVLIHVFSTGVKGSVLPEAFTSNTTGSVSEGAVIV
jgi:hypothetical protein